jgi:3-methyladenine DNA glycosylase/8-oxoguanine DNA glycosylase
MNTPGAMAGIRCTITPPPGFDFWRTVRSHGWYDLPPFAADPASKQLERVLRLADGTQLLCVTARTGRRISCRLMSSTPLSPAHRREAIAQMRACFRLDEDFSVFHRETRRHPHYRWIAAAGAGRLLRAPTVFEDIVKMLCTTNCSWALTVVMARNLAEAFGEPWCKGRYSFPTPAALAGATERELRTQVRAGYRAPYLLRFAEEVAANKRDVESWRSSPLPSAELFDALRTIRGVGPYAAGNMLKLLGRYDYLALDSWVRGRYAALHAGGRSVSDRTIERKYRDYGRWRGLVFWLEMTRSWHEEKFPGKARTTDGRPAG